MPNHRTQPTRRDFLKYAAAAPLILTGCATTTTGAPRPVPSGRITLGCIGVGNQGINDMRAFQADERVQVVAVCDVNADSDGYWGGRRGGREFAREIVEANYARETPSGSYKGCDTYVDYRDLLARDDIDAVLFAVPDHWHALPVCEAAAAGKDIYGEKPLALTIADGRAMSDTVRHYGRIFQTGSQQRSDARFRFACEIVRNGRLGELQRVECGLPGGTPDVSRNGSKTATEPVPEGFDFDRWLGPAPKAPYCPARAHVNWRWVLDYSGGQITDWGGHHPDIAQWGMGTTHTGPVAVRNAKAVWADHPIYNTAVEYTVDLVYANGVTVNISDKNRSGVTFIGSEGWVWVDRGGIEAEPAGLLETEFGPNETRLTVSDHHIRNFVDSVRQRREPIAPIEEAHRSITLSHLGNIAMRLERDLEWDPDTEQFPGDAEANAMLSRPYRGPWKQPKSPKRS